MAEVLLLHHVLGRTKGIEAIADQLRDAGHTVHITLNFFCMKAKSISSQTAVYRLMMLTRRNL